MTAMYKGKCREFVSEELGSVDVLGFCSVFFEHCNSCFEHVKVTLLIKPSNGILGVMISAVGYQILRSQMNLPYP